MQFHQSGDTTKGTSCPIFDKKEGGGGGYLKQNIFINDFLNKKCVKKYAH